MHGSMTIKVTVFVLYGFRTKLLAVNHLAFTDSTVFVAERKY